MSQVILIVDDDPGIRDMLSRNLRYRGYEVEAVDGTEAALEVIGEGRVSAAFVDFFMPGTCGLAAIRKIVAKDPGLRLIVLTGAPLAPREMRELEALGAHYQPKPFQNADLIQALESVLV